MPNLESCTSVISSPANTKVEDNQEIECSLAAHESDTNVQQLAGAAGPARSKVGPVIGEGAARSKIRSNCS